MGHPASPRLPTSWEPEGALPPQGKPSPGLLGRLFRAKQGQVGAAAPTLRILLSRRPADPLAFPVTQNKERVGGLSGVFQMWFRLSQCWDCG